MTEPLLCRSDTCCRAIAAAGGLEVLFRLGAGQSGSRRSPHGAVALADSAATTAAASVAQQAAAALSNLATNEAIRVQLRFDGAGLIPSAAAAVHRPLIASKKVISRIDDVFLVTVLHHCTYKSCFCKVKCTFRPVVVKVHTTAPIISCI